MRVFSWKKQGEFTKKTVQFASLGSFFVNSLNSETPLFREPARESALVWFAGTTLIIYVPSLVVCWTISSPFSRERLSAGRGKTSPIASACGVGGKWCESSSICHLRHLMAPKSGNTPFCQRAANGGLDPSWLDLVFLGAPMFTPEVPK